MARFLWGFRHSNEDSHGTHGRHGPTIVFFWVFWGQQTNHPQKDGISVGNLNCLTNLHAFNKEEQKATQKSSIFSLHPKSRKTTQFFMKIFLEESWQKQPHFPPNPPKMDQDPNPKLTAKSQSFRYGSTGHSQPPKPGGGRPGGSNHEMRTLIWSDPKTNVSGASGKPPITSAYFMVKLADFCWCFFDVLVVY